MLIFCESLLLWSGSDLPREFQHFLRSRQVKVLYFRPQLAVDVINKLQSSVITLW